MPDSPDHAEPRSRQVDALVASYRADDRTHHINATFLPSRDRTIDLFKTIRLLIYPGFFEHRRLNDENLHSYTTEVLDRMRADMAQQVDSALRYAANLDERGKGDACEYCDVHAMEKTDAFIDRLPELRRILADDVQAAFDGDPAARNTDEAIFCYPGVCAVTAHRVAHELLRLEVPLLPRIISEYAHTLTGIDIHPAATIGRSFFIDHGTGVVIGETAVIGDRVKLYQGVTIGALSADLSVKARGRRRHPTIEDDVVIYAGATILGGQTTIGTGSIIGGGVFITRSVPPGHFVAMKSPELKYRSADVIQQQIDARHK